MMPSVVRSVFRGIKKKKKIQRETVLLWICLWFKPRQSTGSECVGNQLVLTPAPVFEGDWRWQGVLANEGMVAIVAHDFLGPARRC